MPYKVFDNVEDIKPVVPFDVYCTVLDINENVTSLREWIDEFEMEIKMKDCSWHLSAAQQEEHERVEIERIKVQKKARKIVVNVYKRQMQKRCEILMANNVALHDVFWYYKTPVDDDEAPSTPTMEQRRRMVLTRANPPVTPTESYHSDHSDIESVSEN